MQIQPIKLPETLRQVMNDAAVSSDMRFAFNAKDEDVAELLVMGDIGDKFEGLGADQIVKQLSDWKGKHINVRINSPGGLAYDGLQIFNALIQHDAGVTTTVEGMAGSAASLIAMAGNPVKMYENTNNFLHRAKWGLLGYFNAITLRDLAESLDALDDAIVRTYTAKTGLSARKVNELLDGRAGDGTTLTARDALKLGFADEIVELKRPKRQKNETSTPVGETQVSFVVPGNPPNGDGFAQTATWSGLDVSDFTLDAWENVGPNTRAAISRHFAVVPDDVTTATFDELLLPHHDAAGNPVLDAVKDALGKVGELPEDVRGDVEAHLTAHLPPEPDPLRSVIEKRMVELRLQEIG